jgi:hypothetical protein
MKSHIRALSELTYVRRGEGGSGDLKWYLLHPHAASFLPFTDVVV